MVSGVRGALPGITAVDGGVKGLPYADPDRVFPSLEAYLEHRRAVATMGAPVLEAIGAGRFRETSGRSRSRFSREFTRADLLRRYGFR